MMSVRKKQNYDEAIRHSIEHEDEVRNQRTNWFLAFQGVLIGGVLSLFESSEAAKVQEQQFLLLIWAALAGIITSLGFIHAAWRSERAISMLLACWDEVKGKYGLNAADYFPVMPLTNNIISKAGTQPVPNASSDDQYAHSLAGWMHISRCDKIRNHFDFLLPFKFLPRVFLTLWLIVLISAINRLSAFQDYTIEIPVNSIGLSVIIICIVAIIYPWLINAFCTRKQKE